MANSDKVDLKSVNKTKKQLKLPKLPNPFNKQKGPLRDQEGKFAAKSGGGGLKNVRRLDLKRAIPLVAVVVLAGGSLVYQSYASACSITADRTSLYTGESTTIRWKSPAVPVVIDGGNMGSLKNGQWGTGALNATKTFKLIGGWDSSCTDSVTVTVTKKPTTDPANPATPAPANPATPTPGAGSTALTDADAKFKWTDAQVKTARQNRDKAKSIAAQGSISRAQLDSIASLEKWVRDAVTQSTPFIGQVQTAYNQAKAAKKSQDEQNKLLYYSGAINNNVQEMNKIITEISNSYNTARQKYESGQTSQAISPAPKDVIGTTPVPTPAPGLTQQQRVDYARNYCNGLADYSITRDIDGGKRGELRDYYHTGTNTWCNNRLIRVTWIICNSGYKVSESADGKIKVCVKVQAEQQLPSFYALPKLPYKECFTADIGKRRCIRSLEQAKGRFKEFDYPVHYVSKINHCERINWGFGVRDSNCKTQTGKWRNM